MTDNNSAPVPPAPQENKQSPEQQEGDLRAELARTRKRSNVMTAVAVSLGIIFVILAGVVYVVYNKISAAKETFEDSFRAMPVPAQAGYQPETRQLPGQGVFSSTFMPVSSLGLFSGGVPGVPGEGASNFTPEDADRVRKAFDKYMQRPVMKELLGELKKNPEVKAAMESPNGGNPLALMALAQNSKDLNLVMLKYSVKPEFIKTMMEMANDPAIKAMSGVMQGAAPQGQVVSVPAQPQTRAQPEDSDGDGEITFDPSAISGPAKTSQPSAKRPPSPVDSGQ